MKSALKTSITLMCMGALSACSGTKNNAGGVSTINSAVIVADQTLSPQEKADKLTLAAEQLVTPTGFMYADLIFDQALTQNPNNKKAQFYKAFLAEPMALQGILTRIKPMAYANSKSKKQYEDAISGLPNSALKTFLFDGKENIKTEKDAQIFADELYKGSDKFRRFLKANKDLDLTLNLNDWALQSSINKTTQECDTKQIQDGIYEVQKCDLTHALEVKLNRADIEALQQIAAGVQIYMSMATSYDLSGVINASEKFEGQDVSNKTIWKELTKNSDFATIRNSGAALKAIIGLGIDGVSGVRWASQMQKELCPTGDDQAKNRPGFLFESGICIPTVDQDGTTLEDTLKLVEVALSGRAIELAINDHGDKTQIQPAAVLTEPIRDLKVLRPVFNSCNQMQSVSDDTFGGLFPLHNANEVLSSSADCGN